jgi:flagellar basal body-associated protein FliL
VPVVAAANEGSRMSLLWIILIVVLVLVLFGFVGRGRF